MEPLNKVELKGYVGTVASNPIGDTIMIRFSVMTEYCNKSQEGEITINTSWHSCVSFDKDAAKLKKNDKVHLIGRIRYQGYIDSNGNDERFTDILVNKLEILN